MASVVLSFVGQQDPVSGNTNEEGPIVTLLRHLLSTGQTLRCVILIYTTGTESKARDTQEWLASEPALQNLEVHLMPTSDALSQDPTDLLEATQVARQAIEQSRSMMAEGDRLEFNASSGTPAMKSSFSILQAAGYAPESTVWQVRNPKEMREGQERVFATNVSVLRQEFDRQAIANQLQQCNYSGALDVLQRSSLHNDRAIALLEYGRCRMAFDFDTAYNHLAQVAERPQQLWQEIGDLRQRQLEAIARELYFNATVRLQQREYSEFLVLLTQFQECVLAIMLRKELGLDLPREQKDTQAFWQAAESVDDGRPFASLEEYYAERKWTLERIGFPKRSHAIGLLRSKDNCQELLKLLAEFNDYCEQRNRCVHRFEGVSELADGDKLLNKMRRVVRGILPLPRVFWFQCLHQEVMNTLR
ncbi:MAG: hypothetical protein ACUVSQ_11730 [Pseudanabaenaceae cyanobacterium]